MLSQRQWNQGYQLQGSLCLCAVECLLFCHSKSLGSGKIGNIRIKVCALTFAGSDVVEVQLVALLGSLQGALGGKEVARGVVGLVVGAADLRRKTQTDEFSYDSRASVGCYLHDVCHFISMFNRESERENQAAICMNLKQHTCFNNSVFPMCEQIVMKHKE